MVPIGQKETEEKIFERNNIKWEKRQTEMVILIYMNHTPVEWGIIKNLRKRHKKLLINLKKRYVHVNKQKTLI